MAFYQILVLVVTIVDQPLYETVPSHVISVESKHNMSTVVKQSFLHTFRASAQCRKLIDFNVDIYRRFLERHIITFFRQHCSNPFSIFTPHNRIACAHKVLITIWSIVKMSRLRRVNAQPRLISSSSLQVWWAKVEEIGALHVPTMVKLCFYHDWIDSQAPARN